MNKYPKQIPTISFKGNIPHNAYRFSQNSMATTFEIYAIHEDADYLEQAVREAFRELDRLEQELSRFIPNSDISRINNLRKNQSTRIGLDAFECLKLCAMLSIETHGAFDITQGKDSRLHSLKLDESNMNVTLLDDSIHIDLGGFAKGYALDVLSKLLLEWDIKSALIHGGMSSVLALAEPPGENGWPVTMSHPAQGGKIISTVYLKLRALSGSGLQKGSHILNPNTGKPVEDRLAAWASTPDGAKSDALSTAFMVMAPEEIDAFCNKNPDTGALVILKNEKEREKKTSVFKYGDWNFLG
jgi:thiamine biosynthesis lipoprotein